MASGLDAQAGGLFQEATVAKHNACDILTLDWNPVIGCERCSPGCRRCWFLDFIFPWQQRLGNIPKDARPDRPTLFPNRLTLASLKAKKGIIGVCQHGDLFWDRVDDGTIHQVLDVLEEAAGVRRTSAKYVLWTKRVERLAGFLANHYPKGLPDHLACAVSIENQEMADLRLPLLLDVPGTRIAVLEPMMGPVDLAPYLHNLDWIVVGSETGARPGRPLDLDWVRQVRDLAVGAGVPFFIKQLNADHGKKAIRILDGRTWDEFPAGFVK
jgi:protein gp37